MSNIITFDQLSKDIFAKYDATYDEAKNLMIDLFTGNLDGLSKNEANDKLRNLLKGCYGLDGIEKPTPRQLRYAHAEHDRQVYQIIEEAIDITVSLGLQENEWFNALVNMKNLAAGDENLFVVEDDNVVLSIARMGKRHHDTILQRLMPGRTYSIDTDVYGAAVGADIDLFILGREPWDKLVRKITEAFVKKIQNLLFAEVSAAVNQLPVQTGFVDSGALANTATVRAQFNKIPMNVSIANNNADVVIMGTMLALQQLENLIQINWIADSMKEDVANNSRLGNYGRYNLVEIPQRFKTLTTAGPTYEFANDKLYFFATGENKIVDFVDVGETIIDQIDERGEANGRIDDTKKYEAQREFGCAFRPGTYFGCWTITQ